MGRPVFGGGPVVVVVVVVVVLVVVLVVVGGVPGPSRLNATWPCTAVASANETAMMS